MAYRWGNSDNVLLILFSMVKVDVGSIQVQALKAGQLHRSAKSVKPIGICCINFYV